MNNSNNIVNNQYLLNVPIAYLLQEKSVEKIEQDFDSNGWNVLHHAVAEADINKINELIHFSFNWGVNGTSNCIPNSTYNIVDKKKTEKIRLLNRMPFCTGGYTPVHLALYLYNHYNNIFKNGDYSYHSLSECYKNIYRILIKDGNHWKSYLDSDGNSLVDYTFLLEDFSLIQEFYLKDPTFSSLKKISPSVTKKIIELMNMKKKIGTVRAMHASQEDIEHMEVILAALDKKILNESLNSELTINSEKKKSIQKI